jgi:hypothetical protein
VAAPVVGVAEGGSMNRWQTARRWTRDASGRLCHDERGPLIVNRPRKALWRGRSWAAIAVALGCVPLAEAVLWLGQVDRVELLASYSAWVLLHMLSPVLLIVGMILRFCALAETRLPHPELHEDGQL